MPKKETSNEVTQEQMEKLAHQSMAQQAATQARRPQKKDKPDHLVNPEQVRKRLKISLLAMELKTDTRSDGSVKKWYEPNEKQALINQEGFKKIWSLVEGTINENLTGGYFDKTDEYYVGVSVMFSLVEQIRTKWDEWDINSVEDARQICSIVSSNLKAVTSKARGGRALKYKGEQVSVRRLEKEGDDSGSGFSWLGL